MQYGIEVKTYKRVEPQSVKKRSRLVSRYNLIVLYFVVGFLVSRVSIPITGSIIIAPFGLAYLWSIIDSKDIRNRFICLIAVGLGYLTLNNSLSDIWIYEVGSVFICLYSLIKNKFNLITQRTTIISIFMIIFFVYGVLFTELNLSENIFYSLVKAGSIFPIYYIFRYSLNCLSNINHDCVFSPEELISLSLVLCICIIGINNLEVVNINLQNVFSLFTVLTLSYIGGAGYGASIGVCIGFLSGISGSNMVMNISLYSVCGLMGGIFKDAGKIFSTLAYSLAFLILLMYSNSLSITLMIELVMSVSMFNFIPNKLVDYISKEFNRDNKIDLASDIQIKGIKEEFSNKVEALKSVLSTMAVSINNLTENDKLLLKNKESALVESLADRVCHNCKKQNKCWGTDLHLTYSLFTDVINSCELGKIEVPKNLLKRCENSKILYQDVEDILMIYKAKETAKNRLTESRMIIANHINSIALKLGQMFREFENDVDACLSIDKVLKRRCRKQGIRYQDIYSYTDNYGRLKIKVILRNGDDKRYCIDSILPMINGLVNMPVTICEQESYFDVESGLWKVVIEETPKFIVNSYCISETKEGEEYCGDNAFFGEIGSGSYVTIVSDGMGSGAGAGVESKVCIDLIQKYLEAGYTIDTAIDVVNSIMSMKFSEDEKFATLDYNSIDLYTGESVFVKLGGVVSLIKKEEEVKVVKNNSLPFGIVDVLEVDKDKIILDDKDIVVTITDGIIDCDKENIGRYLWLKDFLEDYDGPIEALANEIINKSKKISSGRILDDMTVVVSKVNKVY